MSKISVTLEGITYDVDVRLEPGDEHSAVVEIDGETLHVSVPHLDSPDQVVWALVEGRPYDVVFDRRMRWIRSLYGQHRLGLRDMAVLAARPASGDGRVKAPIPGQIVRVLVSQGDHVEAGQPLLALEAMKMENEVRAPRSGTVAQLNASVGKNVVLHEVMAEIV
jgi:acetyl/propionyl-CoA carboxylase alpha subunit